MNPKCTGRDKFAKSLKDNTINSLSSLLTYCFYCVSSYASLALMQTFLEQKHAKAMVELESDMLAELEKSKSELNQQLEQDLSQELEVERENQYVLMYWNEGVWEFTCVELCTNMALGREGNPELVKNQ